MEILDIKLEQLPIIKYDAIDEIANQVANRMNDLKLDELEVSEANFKEVKKIRTELNKEFAEYENKRKLIKDMVMKPYNDFEEKYKKIAIFYKGADEKLKTNINLIEDKLLNEKIDKLKDSFKDTNKYEWLSFEDLNLKITRSTSDKVIIDQINEAFSNIKNDLATIETLLNKERILAKYQITKDLNMAISQTNIEIERENAIANKEKENEEAKQFDTNVKESIQEQQNAVSTEEVSEQVYQASFKVTGTKKQLQDLKKYMKEIGIVYE